MASAADAQRRQDVVLGGPSSVIRNATRRRPGLAEQLHRMNGGRLELASRLSSASSMRTATQLDLPVGAAQDMELAFRRGRDAIARAVQADASASAGWEEQLRVAIGKLT